MSAMTQATKKQEEQELCVFHGEAFPFAEICCSRRNLNSLIVIGQPSITSLDGISELIHLRELWVVECQVKETDSIERCINLEKIYLYSNQIDKIPNLANCERLTTLNLAGNHINRLRNIRGLALLQELNLANNNLRRLLDFFPRNGLLRGVNFAANPLYVLKDIVSLLGQKNLEDVIFADPLYGECPLVRLCHYRYHVINYLPGIKELDHYDVTDEERQLANSFIREKKIFYNVLWHSALNKYWVTQKNKYEEYYKGVFHVRSKLEIEKFLEEKFENQNCKEISEGFSKLRTQYAEIVEWEKKELDKLEVFQHQLQLKFQYTGNVDFIECENKIIKTCQSLLEDSLCQFIRNAGVTGVNLSRVTKLKNNGVKALQSLKASNEESSADRLFMFLVSPCGVGTMKKWPFLLSENQFLTEKEVWISDCLGSADANWLKEFSSEKSSSKKYKKGLETRVCVLVQCSEFLLKKCENSGNFKNVHLDNNKNCQEFCLVRVEKVTPIFVIEYNYYFEKQDFILSPAIQLPSLATDLNSINMNLELKTNEELKNLTSLNLSHQGLAKIEFSEFPKLKELNLSYNQLTKFPDVQFFKELAVLNLSFNQIKSLNIKERLVQLKKLNISWNNLTEYLPCIQTFEIFSPNLTEINTVHNPFKDIIQPESRANMIQIFLPDVQFLDGFKIEDRISREFRSVRKFCNGSMNVFDKVMKVSTTVYKINEDLRTLKSDETSRRIKRLNVSGNMMRDMNFTGEFPALQELCMSNNILIQISTVPLRNLVKLNLSSNFIKNSEGLKKENLPVLRYLDLSNNLISSLLAMGNHDHLTEFYCYQNRITEMSELLNLRSWNELKVVDLSDNGVTDLLWRTFLLFHLPKIRYVNGELVEESDILEAKSEFSGSLSKMTLMISKSLSELQNIKELSIVSCYIKKVNLPADCLPKLESLDLRKNQISYLWGLHLLPKLKTLCLSYNRVEVFDQIDSKKNLINTVFPNLITLYLDHNRIRSLQGLKLGKCLKLKHLFLQYNHLQDIDGLQNSINLETLVLDYNEIRTITMENFDPNNNISTLFLENNSIKYLCFVKNLPKLETLLIANNKIEDQNYLKELSSLSGLRELSLFGNPLCKKTRNHYKFVLQFLECLLIVDGIDVLQPEN